MKKMKKVFAMLLALAMVLGMSMTAFATEAKQTPKESDHGEVSVTNVKQTGVTVTAYQIVDATYDSRGFTGYTWVSGTGYTTEEGKENYRALFTEVGTGADKQQVLNVTEEALAALAVKAKDGSLGNGTQMTGTSTEYKADLTVGTYIVLVTGSNDTIYNPMVVSVYYSTTGSGDNATVQTGTVSAEDKWTLVEQDAFAKSSTPDITKKIKGTDENHASVVEGSEVSFEITTTIPSYSDEYTAPVFRVTDTMSEGLTYKDGTLKIYTTTGEGESLVKEEITDNASFKSVPTVTNGSFTVDFTSDYIKANSGANILIEYTATVNGKAVNFVASENSATLTYSNSPDMTAQPGTKNDTTYHYTFAIGANVNGESTLKTNVLNKVKQGGEVSIDEETKEITVSNPLGGAKFELRTTDETMVWEATSDATTGALSFKGIPAGDYKLVEVEAPQGYSLDATEHTVKIEAIYFTSEDEAKAVGCEVGELKSYTITIDGKADATATYTKQKNEAEEVVIDNTTSGAIAIMNTSLSELPSTGGIGTTIFTIAGCLIMVVAAGLFFASRRKSAAK